MKVYLEVLSGPADGTVFNFSTSVIIGRDKDCDIPLPLDNFLSRRHAQILVIEPECFLEDLGSTNGTFVNEERLDKRVLLENGQLFRIGKTYMRIKW
jgi:pSer/pThr/pTyr-binding forkhead associated (FHA) protein